MSKRGMTLDRHILEAQRRRPGATGELSVLLSQISLASKIINSKVNAAGLADVLGLTGEVNVHGEEVQRLDDFAQATIVRSVEAGGLLCAMASEEAPALMLIPEPWPTGKYVLLFDPLDGSSNIDVNAPIGTIFSIQRRQSTGRDGTEADCLQRGSAQVVAGYVVYGSSTMLVYTTGDGVHGFTFDPSVGEFFLSHENLRMPARGSIYSINEANSPTWDARVEKLVAEYKASKYSARYVGTLVADLHRTLLKGGIFMYPANHKNPNGKLRLLYECNPMAFLVEQAGGAATDGKTRILDLVPRELHQRTPLYIGSKEDVALATERVSS